MAAPWVLLYRVVRADHAAAAGPLPDFTLPVAAPPGFTVLAAGRGAHPDPNRPDAHPFIIAAAPNWILASFAVAPSIGENFDDNPRDTRLVVVRDFLPAAGGQILTASAELIPDRADPIPNISNIRSVGIGSNDVGGYTIAELQVRKGAADATLLWFDSELRAWFDAQVDSPFPAHERDRDWVPHGVVVVETTLWWFDLSRGIISWDIGGDLDLLFHPLPGNRALPAPTEFMLCYRGITVSQGELRYVEIIREGAGAVDDGGDSDADVLAGAAVHMWTMGFGVAGWEWQGNYAVSFEEIWNHKSYTDTGLPRMVPVLAAVSPSDPNVVYFTLRRRIFGVNVQERRVVHEGPGDVVVNNVTLEAQHAGHFLLPWHLPPAVAPAPGAAAGINLGG